MTTLFQTGTLIGFLQGVYEGNCTVETLLQKGDTGLGTYNGIDGEMIVLEGQCYRVDAKGKVHVASRDLKTPYALVAPVKPNLSFILNNVPDIAQLNALLTEKLPSRNVFYMITLQVEAQSLVLRSEACQLKPYHPLAETMPKVQTLFNIKHSKGTLVSTYCPSYLPQVTIPGFHYHYIDDERAIGGHVFAANIKRAEIAITPIYQFELALINSPAFETVDLSLDVHSALKHVE